MKPWWKSKTVWFNVISGLLVLAETQLALVKPIVGEALYPIVALTVMGVNVFLRIISTQALTVRGAPDTEAPR